MARNSYNEMLIGLNGAFPPTQRKELRRAFGTTMACTQDADDTATQSSTTLAAASEMYLNDMQVGTWLIVGSLTLTIANAAHNIKFDFNGGTITNAAGATAIGGGNFYLANGTSIAPAISALNTSLDGSTSNAWIRFDFQFVLSTPVPGNLVLQRAQSASGASNSVIKAGSIMVARRLF